MAEQVKTRYSDEELAEFKEIIEGMLEKARAEYNTLRSVVMHGGNNDIEDTSPSFRTVEDDGANQLTKEEASQLAPKERLRLVPHATLTVEAKEMLAKQGKN